MLFSQSFIRSLFFSSPSIFICHFSLFAGPGPVDTPTVTGLQPHSVSITWVPPTQPNGIITNYTLYLYLSSVTSSEDKPGSFSSNRWTPNPSLLPSTKGAHLHSGYNLRPLSSLTTTQDSSHVSTLKPGTVDHQADTHVGDVNQGTSSVLFRPTEPDIASVTATLSLTPEYSAVSYNTEHFIEDGPFHSTTSGSSRSTPLSVTLPGNITNYTFLSLLPYQAYSLQVLHFNMGLVDYRFMMFNM